MNGMDKITDQIQVDAQREIDTLLATAADQAGQIAAQAQASAQTQGEELLRLGREEAARREERSDRSAALEGRKCLLSAKGALVSTAFDRALETLAALSDTDYTALLTKLTVTATRTGREQVAFSPRDRNRVGKAVVTRANEILGPQAALTLAEGTRSIRGGVVLTDGRVETNCSLETLVRGLREDLEREVAGVLFEA